MSNSCDPYQISDGKHVMLMCKNEEDRAQAAAYWINQGLHEGPFVFMHPFMHWTCRTLWA